MMGRAECTGVGGLHESLSLEIAGLPFQSRILDIGCGTGAWLERLHELGYVNLTGIDKDISGCRGVSAGLVKADIDWEKVTPSSGPYDLITAIEVIEHMQNPGCLVRFIKENLAENGMALITSPNVQSMNGRVRFLVRSSLPNFDGKGEPTHLYPVLLEGFRKLLFLHGLVLVKIWSFPPEGGVIYRGATRFASAILRAFIPDSLRGDILCMEIQHAASSSAECGQPTE